MEQNIKNLSVADSLPNRGIGTFIVKLAVEFENGCFIEHNLNSGTDTLFYSVKYPDGVILDFKRLCDARRSTSPYMKKGVCDD